VEPSLGGEPTGTAKATGCAIDAEVGQAAAEADTSAGAAFSAPAAARGVWRDKNHTPSAWSSEVSEDGGSPSPAEGGTSTHSGAPADLSELRASAESPSTQDLLAHAASLAMGGPLRSPAADSRRGSPSTDELVAAFLSATGAAPLDSAFGAQVEGGRRMSPDGEEQGGEGRRWAAAPQTNEEAGEEVEEHAGEAAGAGRPSASPRLSEPLQRSESSDLEAEAAVIGAADMLSLSSPTHTSAVEPPPGVAQPREVDGTVVAAAEAVGGADASYAGRAEVMGDKGDGTPDRAAAAADSPTRTSGPSPAAVSAGDTSPAAFQPLPLDSTALGSPRRPAPLPRGMPSEAEIAETLSALAAEAATAAAAADARVSAPTGTTGGERPPSSWSDAPHRGDSEEVGQAVAAPQQPHGNEATSAHAATQTEPEAAFKRPITLQTLRSPPSPAPSPAPAPAPAPVPAPSAPPLHQAALPAAEERGASTLTARLHALLAHAPSSPASISTVHSLTRSAGSSGGRSASSASTATASVADAAFTYPSILSLLGGVAAGTAPAPRASGATASAGAAVRSAQAALAPARLSPETVPPERLLDARTQAISRILMAGALPAAQHAGLLSGPGLSQQPVARRR
jgi:hypothetical protein